MDWISVEDRLPRVREGSCFSDDLLFVIADKGSAHVYAGYLMIEWQNKYIWCTYMRGNSRPLDDNHDSEVRVTHWMPIPKPPEDE